MMTDQKNYTTNQTRQIDRTQWYTMQDEERWKRTIVGDIQYISNTRDNPADDGLTKTLGRIMHNEHVYRAMGLYDSLHKFGSYKNSHEENNHEQNEFNIVWVIEFGEDVAVYFMVLVINIGELSQQYH